MTIDAFVCRPSLSLSRNFRVTMREFYFIFLFRRSWLRKPIQFSKLITTSTIIGAPRFCLKRDSKEKRKSSWSVSFFSNHWLCLADRLLLLGKQVFLLSSRLFDEKWSEGKGSKSDRPTDRPTLRLQILKEEWQQKQQQQLIKGTLTHMCASLAHMSSRDHQAWSVSNQSREGIRPLDP